MNPYFILFYFFFFSLPFHFLFAIGPQQTTPPLSAIATAAGRFRFRFMCPIVAGIRGRTRSYDPYGEEEGNLTQRGFIYNHFLRQNNTEVWRCYTHAGGPGREWGGKKWRKYHTPHTSLPGEEIVSKDDYNYTTGVLVGFDWVFFLFLLLFLFLLFTPSPSSLASPATCTEGNRLIEYWADSAALHWAFVLQWEGIHISVYMHV